MIIKEKCTLNTSINLFLLENSIIYTSIKPRYARLGKETTVFADMVINADLLTDTLNFKRNFMSIDYTKQNLAKNIIKQAIAITDHAANTYMKK